MALAVFPLIGEDLQYAQAAERARLSRPPMDPDAEAVAWKEHVRLRPGVSPGEVERDLADTAALQDWLSHRLAAKHIRDAELTWGLLSPEEREIPYGERCSSGGMR